jgi:hypothetical protein
MTGQHQEIPPTHDDVVTYAIEAVRARRLRTDRLVSLLHERSELRGTYAPADYLDQAVRGGA